MIQAGLIFLPSKKRELLQSILRLPGRLQPDRMSVGEDEAGSVVRDDPACLDKLADKKSGFFLKNRNCYYDVDFTADLPIEVTCFFDTPMSDTKMLMTQLAKVGPLFGFACLPKEREAKNRVIIKIGINTIESWVGCKIRKSIPGLYWWTIIPSSLADAHGIPLAALESAAKESIEVISGTHLFRFHERQEDWQDSAAVDQLTKTCPGIFNVEMARQSMGRAKTWLEMSGIARQWR